MTRAETDNVAFMKDIYAAMGRGDVPTVLAALDEGVEWYETEGNPWFTGQPFIGVQQVVDGVFRRIADEWDGFEIKVTRFVGSGDTVIMEGRYWAKNVRASGKPLDCEVVHVWDVRDGKIVRFHQYVDTRKLTDDMSVSV
jgi:ketosteroid isomerase-like protein